MKKYIVGIFVFLFSISIRAETRPMVTFTMGGDQANIATHATNIIFIPPFFNTYVPANNDDLDLFGGIFLGAETTVNLNWSWQYGISYYQASPFEMQGTINQFGNPEFANLTYTYEIQSRRAFLETKVLYSILKLAHPYLNLAIGEAFNKACNYKEYPVTSDAVPMADPFENKISHQLTYFIGLGMDFDMNQHMRLGVGYRYVNLGKAELGDSPLQQDTTTIENNSIHMNEYFVQLTLLS
ncbi:MAG: outer membrane beta-barrel protein [Gammaproteobacteria bacterium]|nr:outer membrane beta-barrel protein [Gammaproteobacteria bacterium]